MNMKFAENVQILLLYARSVDKMRQHKVGWIVTFVLVG